MAKYIEIRTPEPHSESQRQIISGFVTPHLKEIVIACGTKYGKSISGAAALCLAAPLKKQTLWRWVGPIYSQSRIGFKYCRRMLPPDPIVTANESSLSLSIKRLDTVLQFFHGQNAESIEGEACHGYVIDEAAKQKYDVYAAAKTTTTLTRGPIIMMSTPKGKNWFYRKALEARDEMERAAHEGRPPRMIFITAPTADNPHVPRESIIEAKETLPPRLFSQYYEALFIDDGGVFTFLDDAFGKTLDAFVEAVWFSSSHNSQSIFIGADWAKTNDYSVFTALNNEGIMIGYKRLNRVRYPDQVAALYAFAYECRRNSTNQMCDIEILHDKTGVGEAIDDIIAMSSTSDLNINGIVWNNTNKESAVNDLILSLEEKALHLWPSKVMKEEMASFEVTTLISGRPRYAAPEGMHDDTVMSLVLANMLFRSGRGLMVGVSVMDQINNIVRKIYYNGGELEDVLG